MSRPPTRRDIEYGCALERHEPRALGVPRPVTVAAVFLLALLLVLLVFGGPLLRELMP